VRKGKKKKRAWWAQVESAGRESVLFFFQVPLKPTLPLEGQAWEIPTNNEQVGRGMDGSQPGEGGVVWAIHRQLI
jgi:hypothetical protein